MTGCSNWRYIVLAAALIAPAQPSYALDSVTFRVQSEDETLSAALQDASLLFPFRRGSKLPAQDIMSKARAEYAVLLDALYARGYFGAEITVLVDGREAANIELLDSPDKIAKVEVLVTSGPEFVFGRTKVAPFPGTARPVDGFARGEVAASGVILDATAAGIDEWRKRGFAMTKVAKSTLLADHQNQKVDVDIVLEKGPLLSFGKLSVRGEKNMHLDRVIAIAGLPTGEQFAPEELDIVAQRLRRTGAFRSVAIQEGTALDADGNLPITAILVEERLRRLAVSTDVASLDGVTVGVVGAHRNLFGGAERLTLSAYATGIGVDSGGLDYTLSATYERPATFTPDTTFSLGVQFDREQDARTTLDATSSNAKLTQYFSNTLTGNGGVAYQLSRAVDPSGTTIYKSLSFPLGLAWDTRNIQKSASEGVYITADVKPYVGFGGTESGVRSEIDARGYLGVTPSDSLILAARVQMGMITGSSLAGAPREDLFYSGGPSTVRGQPYKSLGVFALTSGSGTAFETGGTHYLGGSFEARQKVSDSIGLVGFLDAGRIDVGGFFETKDNWHAGAGVGVRYMTAIGPVRLDVAGPVAGDTGGGAQVYIGIGQAF